MDEDIEGIKSDGKTILKIRGTLFKRSQLLFVDEPTDNVDIKK